MSMNVDNFKLPVYLVLHFVLNIDKFYFALQAKVHKKLYKCLYFFIHFLNSIVLKINVLGYNKGVRRSFARGVGFRLTFPPPPQQL